MTTSSLRERRKALDKPTAWACTVTNLLVLPGLGSLAAGKKRGYAQAALAVLGFVGSMIWLVAFARAWLDRGEIPTEVGTLFWTGFGSIGLFIASWIWALKTSVDLHREAARHVNRDPMPPSLQA